MKPLVTADDFDFAAADIEFHIREAHRLRSEYAGQIVSTFFHTVVRSIKGFMGRLTFHKVNHA
ncbi:RSP_7527 family protein [Kiloniella antarctica]|uniref:RSP_7527 family protein n=1 Tax=Kiloniella antarctica TaxID=1550907 RepID=A0ABW5BIG7_9PROT